MFALTAGALCDMVEDVTGVTTAGHALKHLNAGYARFLSGLDPRDPSIGSRHIWSFLQPLATLALSYQSTGTATGVYDGSTYTVVTATTAAFEPSNVGDDLVVASTGTYTIAKYVSSTVVWIDGDHAFVSKGLTFPHCGIYDLPSDFGGIIDKPIFPYSTDDARSELTEVSPEEILRDWRDSHFVGTPNKWAVVPLAFTSTTGQRWRMMFSPRVDSDRIVRYRHLVVPSPLTDTSAAVYPLGGATHSQTVKYAALADYETSKSQPGFYEQMYQTHFAASIDHDRQVIRTLGPQHLGHDGPEING